MDPIENIKRQVMLAERIQYWNEQVSGDGLGVIDDALDLAELVLALNEWRRNGGFDPYKHVSPDESAG